jgi:lipopolysaccharide cholinephosphotransferase
METSYNPNEQALTLHGDRVDEETRQVQVRLLGILKAIDQVCREHGLTYYLICGTMLGAIRHGGFIPWDDDADVGMPREDYDMLLAHADEWMPEGYELVSGTTSPHPSPRSAKGRLLPKGRKNTQHPYPYPFARVQESGSTYRMHRSYDFVGGLPIDLFPLDGMVDDCRARRWHYMRYKFWQKMLYFTHTDPYKHGRGFRSMLTLLLRKMYSPNLIHRKLDEVRSQWRIEDSPLIADHDYNAKKGAMPKEWYGTPVPVRFEDCMLMGVAHPDDYLRHLYGDYMQIPKDIPARNYRFLDLNKPWREYVAM